MIDRVIEEVIRNYKIEKSTLLQRNRHISFEAKDVGMYILKMYKGLKNKATGEIFGVSLSAVNKAALCVNIQRKKTKKSWRENRRRLPILLSRSGYVSVY